MKSYTLAPGMAKKMDQREGIVTRGQVRTRTETWDAVLARAKAHVAPQPKGFIQPFDRRSR